MYKRALALLALGAAALAVPSGAAAVVAERFAGMEAGDLSELDQAGAEVGTLEATTERAHTGSHSARAVYSGGGANGFARGIYEVAWQDGDDVTYSSAFHLPAGFGQAMQGQVALMRWDNWPTYGNPGADAGGIVVYGSDKRARLVRARYGGEQVDLVGPFDLPEGRWFTLAVHQRLGVSNAVSEVYLDGQLVGRATAQNAYGRRVDRIRYGIVAIASGAQRNPLTLWFDDAAVAPGPFGGAPAPAPPPPAPEPAPEPELAPEPPPPANAPPAVRLMKPTDGSTFRRALSMAAAASDAGGVARVEFWVDGRLRKKDLGAPYAYGWSSAYRKLSLGRHTVTAIAYDRQGLSARDSVTVTRVR